MSFRKGGFSILVKVWFLDFFPDPAFPAQAFPKTGAILLVVFFPNIWCTSCRHPILHSCEKSCSRIFRETFLRVTALEDHIGISSAVALYHYQSYRHVLRQLVQSFHEIPDLYLLTIP